MYLKRTPYCGLLLALGLLMTPQTHAALIYDNSVNDLTVRFPSGTMEVGDEVNFAGTERYLTRFDFEYYGISGTGGNTFAGDVGVIVRFYKNDGPLFAGYPSPGTLIYQFDPFGPLYPTARNTLVYQAGADFAAGSILLPDTMTWTVQFTGLGPGDQLGVDVYDPPVVGSSYKDVWMRSGANDSWELRQDGIIINFACRFFAEDRPTVPDASSSLVLLLVGCATLIGLKRFAVAYAL